ncbi:MAG: Rpn family recombination-promoting nuclease/putative transposase [Magnetococcales bacterium]|nr:Rpn family recombination-promoting nuclease/putative transposase [Magnetococcales bacterium]
MSDISHPHDNFVRSLLSNPEMAGTLLRERLPKEISDLLSLEPPVLVEGSFVDEALQKHLTDRLFLAKTISGRVALLYCLIEHKSFPKRRTAWQLHRYMLRSLEQWVRENPRWKFLPAIVPFVLYQGKREWKIPNEFMALVDAEAGWRPYLLNFQYTVMDIGKIPDRKLSQQPRLRAWLLVAKYATRTGEQITVKELLIAMLAEATDDFRVIIHYIIETFQDYDETIIREIIHRVRPEEEEKMMSLFARDMLAKGRQDGLLAGEQKGRQDGIQIGERKGKATMLTHQLQRRFGGVPTWASEKIAKADTASLEEWSLRILDAQTLESVFSDGV